MSRFYTKASEGKAFYFDLMTGVAGKTEWVRARPIFAGKESELEGIIITARPRSSTAGTN